MTARVETTVGEAARSHSYRNMVDSTWGVMPHAYIVNPSVRYLGDICRKHPPPKLFDIDFRHEFSTPQPGIDLAIHTARPGIRKTDLFSTETRSLVADWFVTPVAPPRNR